MSKETRGKLRGRKDFSYLLRKRPNTKKAQKAELSHQEPETATPSLWRRQILSDETIPYIVVQSENEIHDKHCDILRKYKDEDILPSKFLDTTRKVCKECALRVYVRYGAIDFAEYRRYGKFFERANVTPEDVRRMYLDEGCETKFLGTDSLWVRCREDCWKINLESVGDAVTLYHNNYVARSDGTREMLDSYHLQTERCSFQYALNLIFSYVYSPSHIARFREAANTSTENQNFALTDTANTYGQERT